MDMQKRIARLLSRHKHRPSDCLRNEIVRHFLHLVDDEAQRLHRRLPRSVELDDLISDGNLGLLDAIDRYDPKKKTRFQTFAPQRIRGAMLDGLRSRDPISRTMRRSIRDLEQAAERVRSVNGSVTPEEVAGEMRVSPKTYAKAAAAAREASIRSLSGNRRSDDEPAGCFAADRLSDTRPTDPARSLAGKQLRDEIVTGLSRSERLITILYYYEELTMKEIGKTLDLSESRVSQMHTSIVKRLRARLNPRLLAA